jgi:pimeloyl-ACP methyl ester carboxylesterase
VTFCRTPDGVNLAVATAGNGLPVVKTANWLNHIEHDWNSPVWSPLLARLAAQFRLIRYDERGSGLSDWDVADASLDALVRDLEAVVDMLDLERFALLGISRGCAVAIAYAARHPDRVSHLVLCSGYVVCWRNRGNPAEIAEREALIALIRNGWGRDNPAFRQVFTSLFVPGATPEQMQWFNDLQRVSASPENAARLFRLFADIDLTDLLPRITAPTLVLHSRGDVPIPFEQGLALARGIANARLVALDSNNHLILAQETAWPRFVDEMCAFLNESRGRRMRLAPSSGKRARNSVRR